MAPKTKPKPTPKSQKQTKFYCCCTKPTCKSYARVVEFVSVWGLDPTLHSEGRRRYFDLTVPEYWLANRRMRFALAVKELPTGH